MELNRRDMADLNFSLSLLLFLLPPSNFPSFKIGIEGVTVIKKYLPYVERSREVLISRSTEILVEGMKELNQTGVATALQVFFFPCLPPI